MSSCREALIALVLAGSTLGAFAQAAKPAAPAEFPGIGRTATPKEVQAWDIDVRPDFKGLPKGAGTVARGQDVWESKCASCHGIFGESNEVFSPIVGGTTAKDIETGRVARLTDESFPGRTTLMKLSSLSTLWDYINRAMPWTNPKTLTPDEVYAVTAFILNLGGIVPDDFTLSDANIAQVQQRLPNRNGKTTDHGLWPGRTLGNGGKPDVLAAACMSNCATEAKVASLLPDHARNAHGNLAEQQRLVGAQLGADTTRPSGATRRMSTLAAVTAPGAGPAAAAAKAVALARQHNCLACHGLDNKVVGPGMSEIARRYAGRDDAVDYLAKKIVAGGSGVWGPIPMPEQSLPAADVNALAAWLAGGAKRP
ncbi:MAG: c-type cytochrome [Rubrivivax sp.]|nr:c-type cytochrome [Rubrivivax sp.]